LRNPEVAVEYRPYKTERARIEFLSGFIPSHSRSIIECGVAIDMDFKGFILTYYDAVLLKTIIVIDVDQIIDIISNI
jgi:hypothetical protein